MQLMDQIPKLQGTEFTTKPVWKKIPSTHNMGIGMTIHCTFNHMTYLMSHMASLNNLVSHVI